MGEQALGIDFLYLPRLESLKSDLTIQLFKYLQLQNHPSISTGRRNRTRK